jgi:hypothetical protein
MSIESPSHYALALWAGILIAGIPTHGCTVPKQMSVCGPLDRSTGARRLNGYFPTSTYLCASSNGQPATRPSLQARKSARG